MLQAEREGRARDKLDLGERRGLASVEGGLDLSTLGTSVDPHRPRLPSVDPEADLRISTRASSASPRASRHDHRVLTGSTVAVSRGSSATSRELPFEVGTGEREQKSWDDAEDKMGYREFVEPRDTQSLPRA